MRTGPSTSVDGKAEHRLLLLTDVEGLKWDKWSKGVQPSEGNASPAGPGRKARSRQLLGQTSDLHSGWCKKGRVTKADILNGMENLINMYLLMK